MTKCSVFIAASLDGYIARLDGDIDWLQDPAYTFVEGEDAGYEGFIATVDYLVMGRHTYEKVLTFDPWPYADLPVVVLSSRDPTILASLEGKVSFLNMPPRAVVRRLATQGAKHLYIDGGGTIQQFLQAGLIDEITLTTIPILLGTGVPLFGPLQNDVYLKLQYSRQFQRGIVQHKYEVTYPD